MAFFSDLSQAKVFSLLAVERLLTSSMFCHMFRKGNRVLNVQTAILGAVLLLAYPCAMLAQHGGGGGGHVGGGTAGGGAMGSGGKATGVPDKDDLKDFHEVLAVQATSQQVIEYAAMLKSTEAASTELKTLLERLGKENVVSEVAGRRTVLDQALERARAENKKFLDKLSEPQKSGLKEISKRLIKADLDLAQQAKELDDRFGDAKSAAPTVASSAQGLDHALASFQSLQLDLGTEMSIGVSDNRGDSAFNLLPVKNSINFANRPIAITTSGTISKELAEGGQIAFKVELTTDLSDLQENITEVLRSQLNKDERCGERIVIHSAMLTPLSPESLVVAQLHFERWACAMLLGRETNSEMAEGNGLIEVKLTPTVGNDGALRLVAEIGRIDAEGLIAELLRSGSLGDELRDKITEAILSTVRQGVDFKATLPPAAQGNTTLLRAQFRGTGSGRLIVVLEGEIRVPNEKATALTSELRARSASAETTQGNVQQSMPR